MDSQRHKEERRKKMISKLTLKRKNQRGFSLVELLIALLIIIILVAVVILVVRGFYGEARESALETDLHTVKTAVDAFMLQSLKWPTETGMAPSDGQYALLNFDASFVGDGKTLKFYPHFLSKLPRHWDEGVWRIDSAALVSIDIAQDEY
jgi:type II secretory pathway pseudopilin PulG